MLAIGLALICGSLPRGGAGPAESDAGDANSVPTSRRSQHTDNGKPKQDVPDEAGGPTDSVGPYAIPKKKVEDAPPPPPVAPKRLEDIPDYSLKVNVPLVNVDVLVTTKDGQFIPGLKQGNFRILEDGVQQQVTHFNVSQGSHHGGAAGGVRIDQLHLSCEMLLQASYAFAGFAEERRLDRGFVLRHAAAHPGGFHAGQESGATER